MARKPRIEFEGAFYHVITRGNQRQKIFKDRADFERYIEILSKYKSLYKYFLYSYVLMSNHVHLLLETGEIPLSKILQGVSQSYTAYFNRKYRTIGHLFQGRYKAVLCDKDEYLLALVKYIHLNPIRAKIAKTLDLYEWSSHDSYVRKADKKGIIDEGQVMRMFSEDRTIAKRLYREYMGEGASLRKKDVYNVTDQRILRSEHFAESLVAKEYGYKGRDIAKYMGRDPAMVTRYIRQRADMKEEMKKVIRAIKNTRSKVNSCPEQYLCLQQL